MNDEFNIQEHMYIIGIDIGSLSTKIALIQDGKLIDTIVNRSTYRFKEVGTKIFEDMLAKHNLTKSQITSIISTGYGRHTLDFVNDRVTEISAHARGVQYFFPDVRSIIDIGGQDSKAIVISKKSGKVIDFQMNDKCAAGTGRFLEVMANALEVPISELGLISLRSDKPDDISSMCTVFAESEVISLFAQGSKKENIAAGLHKAIAKRVGGMAKRLDVQPPLVFCGGVAKNPAVKRALEKELGFEINSPENPQITGALGAALIAHEKLNK